MLKVGQSIQWQGSRMSTPFMENSCNSIVEFFERAVLARPPARISRKYAFLSEMLNGFEDEYSCPEPLWKKSIHLCSRFPICWGFIYRVSLGAARSGRQWHGRDGTRGFLWLFRATHNHIIVPLGNDIILFDEHKKFRMYVLHYPDDF